MISGQMRHAKDERYVACVPHLMETGRMNYTFDLYKRKNSLDVYDENSSTIIEIRVWIFVCFMKKNI